MSEIRLSSSQAVNIICDYLSELALKNSAFAKVDINVVRDVLSGVTKDLFVPCSSIDSFKAIVSECLSNVEIDEKGVQVIKIVDVFRSWFVVAISDLSQETLDHYKSVKRFSIINFLISSLALIVSIVALILNLK